MLRISSLAKGGKPVEPEDALWARKRELHAKSKAEVATWGNTVEGNRRLKLEARSKRNEERERVQEQLDLEEARFQSKERQKAIARCRALQFKQTDMVKSFRSAEYLTEVIRERDAQGDTRDRRAALFDAREKLKFERTVRELDEAVEAERQKQLKAKQAAVDNSKTQLEQAAAKRALRQRIRQAELKEQAAMNEDAEAYQREEAEKMSAGATDRVEFFKGVEAAMAATQAIKKREKQMEELTDMKNVRSPPAVPHLCARPHRPSMWG